MTDNFFEPLILKKGETYVLQCERMLTEEQAERVRALWTEVVGIPPIILAGGLRVARKATKQDEQIEQLKLHNVALAYHKAIAWGYLDEFKHAMEDADAPDLDCLWDILERYEQRKGDRDGSP